MPRLAALVLARPRTALAGWAALVACLAFIGTGVDAKLAPTDLYVHGSQSARALSLLSSQFGDSTALPILLTGPSPAVRSQARTLVTTLEREQGLTLVTPWNAGTARAALRPAPDQLLLIASVAGSGSHVDAESQRLASLVRRGTANPVHASITGMPFVAHDLAGSSVRAIHLAELVAIPILLLVLLLVFRSPLAAAIPVGVGAATVLAAAGVLDLLARVLPLDALATAVASMMGLALAVDYSLLTVARFREERERAAVPEAVCASVAGTRHVVIAAGAAITLAMALTAALSPARPVLSAAVGVGVVALLSVLGATVAVPALLALAGRRIAPLRGGRSGPSVPWRALGPATRRRPWLAALLATGLLAVLALPALSLRTGAPDVRELPAHNAARQAYQSLTHTSGAGWASSFEIVASADNGPMTTTARLAVLDRVQRQLARDRDVAAVFGPGAIDGSAQALRRAGQLLLGQQRALGHQAPAQARNLRRLGQSVSSASVGVDSVRGALGQAAHTATTFTSVSDRAAGGIGRLQSGVQTLQARAAQLRSQLAGTHNGQAALTSGAGSAQVGARRLTQELGALVRGISSLPSELQGAAAQISNNAAAVGRVADGLRARDQGVQSALAAAQSALATSRPSFATTSALSAIGRARSTLSGTDVSAALSASAAQLRSDATATQSVAGSVDIAAAQRIVSQAGGLAGGLQQLQAQLRALGGMVGGLGGRTTALTDAMGQLAGGTAALAGGIQRLRQGASGLQNGVQAGQARTAALAAGINGAQGIVSGLHGAPVPKGTSPASASAAVLDSGYFVLAALDGRKGDSGVNVSRGGQSARILIVPRSGADAPATAALYRRLTATSQALGPALHARTAVGGPAAVLLDYQHSTSGRLPVIVLLLMVATAVLLALVLRAILVPLIALALNLLCVGAALGVLERLFGGAHPLLGGNGRIDATALTTMLAVMFALSIDYQVFILARIREELARGGDASSAIEAGMRRIAGVVSGAAISMIAVFAAFAVTDVASLRMFGVGLAVAVMLDATVVRLVLLLAVLHLAGERAWWPGRLLAAPARRAVRAPHDHERELTWPAAQVQTLAPDVG